MTFAHRGLCSALGLFCLLLCSNVWSQSKAPPAPSASPKSGVEIYNAQKAVINFSDSGETSDDNLNPYNNNAPYNPYYQENQPAKAPYNPNAPYIPGQEPKNEEPKAISRLAGGLSLGMSNVGVIHSLFKQSSDAVYTSKNASEFGFGVSGFLDFAIPGNPGALRLRGGVSRLQIKPNSQTKSAYTGSQLENNETLFNLSAMFRVSLPSDAIGFGVFWAGAGAQLVYAMSTGHFDSSGSRVGGSKLANSYGYSPFVTLGSEIPFTSTEDFTVSADWLPFTGFNVLAGIKTAL